MRRAALLALAALLPLAGCHSPTITATLHNATPGELRLLELDYPSASFGTGTVAAGQDFSYRFKILGSGTTRLTYTDAAGAEHSANGPELHEGLEGRLLVNISSSGVSWTPQFKPSR